MNLIAFSTFRRATGISRTQCYRFFKRKLLTPHKVGTMILIDLEEWNRVVKPEKRVNNLEGIVATSANSSAKVWVPERSPMTFGIEAPVQESAVAAKRARRAKKNG